MRMAMTRQLCLNADGNAKFFGVRTMQQRQQNQQWMTPGVYGWHSVRT